MYNLFPIKIKQLQGLLLLVCLFWKSFCAAQMGLYGNINLGGNSPLGLYNSLYFFNGIIASSEENAKIVFLSNAQAFQASAASYSEVEVAIGTQAD